VASVFGNDVERVAVTADGLVVRAWVGRLLVGAVVDGGSLADEVQGDAVVGGFGTQLAGGCGGDGTHVEGAVFGEADEIGHWERGGWVV